MITVKLLTRPLELPDDHELHQEIHGLITEKINDVALLWKVDSSWFINETSELINHFSLFLTEEVGVPLSIKTMFKEPSYLLDDILVIGIHVDQAIVDQYLKSSSNLMNLIDDCFMK